MLRRDWGAGAGVGIGGFLQGCLRIGALVMGGCVGGGGIVFPVQSKSDTKIHGWSGGCHKNVTTLRMTFLSVKAECDICLSVTCGYSEHTPNSMTRNVPVIRNLTAAIKQRPV